MMKITQTITPLPLPPTRTDMESFDTRADAFLPAIVTLGAEVNVWATQTNAIVGWVDQAQQDVSAAKDAAQAAAESAAGAAAWDIGVSYMPGNCVYGSDGQTYRAVQPSTGVDPVADATGAWVQISALGVVYMDISPGGILSAGGYRLASTGQYLLAADPRKNTRIELVLDCAPTESERIAISRNGRTIDGRDEDLTVEDTRVTRWVMVYNGVTWRVCV